MRAASPSLEFSNSPRSAAAPGIPDKGDRSARHCGRFQSLDQFDGEAPERRFSCQTARHGVDGLNPGDFEVTAHISDQSSPYRACAWDPGVVAGRRLYPSPSAGSSPRKIGMRSPCLPRCPEIVQLDGPRPLLSHFLSCRLEAAGLGVSPGCRADLRGLAQALLEKACLLRA